MAKNSRRKRKNTQQQPIEKPDFNEIATAARNRDLFSGYLTHSVIMENPDEILKKKGRGDFTIYEELLRDDQVKSVFQQRRLSLIGKDWEVLPASESAIDKDAADFLREQLENIDWDGKTDKMLYGVFYGYAVAECLFKQENGRIGLQEIKVRKARRFKFGVNGELRLMTKENPREGEEMPTNKFWTFNTGADNDDNPYGEGLAKSLYWPVFFKRHDIKYWLVFLEKFGMPTAKGEYPRGATPAEKDAIMEALDAIQTDTAIGVPSGTIIELVEASRSGSADYSEMHRIMNQAISKIILSQTMTTDDGSSLAQAKVHSGVKEEVIQADADLICNSFNNTVAKWLTAWNFPNAQPPKVWRRTEDAPDTKQIAERDQIITHIGFKPTQEYIDCTYGEGFIEKPESEQKPITPQINNYTEFHPDGILTRMLKHRGDQDELRQAAQEFGKQYDELIGGRVEDVVALAEQTGDLETLKKELDDLFIEEPQSETIEKIQRAGVVSRLMGALRGQRE